MSEFTLNDGQILIYKVKAEGNKPPVKGKMKIDGQEYEISLWPAKSGKDGSYTGKVQLPYKQRAETPRNDAPARDVDDQDIPF